MINELRTQLEESIERLGTLDIETIMLSRKLDKEINIEQRKRLNLLNKKRTLKKVQSFEIRTAIRISIIA